MAKADIESAFRLLLVHPLDFALLGFWFEGGCFVDRALPMGCWYSYAAFEYFSTFLEWTVRYKSGLTSTAHYHDDFLFISSSRSGQCFHLLDTFRSIYSSLGVPLAEAKTESPISKLSFLGIELDSVQQYSRLPADMLTCLQLLLEKHIAAKKMTLKELQFLIGHLNYACRVVAPGRAFLHRLCDAMAALTSPFHHVQVSVDM